MTKGRDCPCQRSNTRARPLQALRRGSIVVIKASEEGEREGGRDALTSLLLLLLSPPRDATSRGNQKKKQKKKINPKLRLPVMCSRQALFVYRLAATGSKVQKSFFFLRFVSGFPAGLTGRRKPGRSSASPEKPLTACRKPRREFPCRDGWRELRCLGGDREPTAAHLLFSEPTRRHCFPSALLFFSHNSTFSFSFFFSFPLL